MKKIFKHFVSCTAFLLILVFMIYALSMVVKPKTNLKSDGMRYASAYGILGEPSNTLDVVFIGDSEAYSSFIPKRIWKDHGITSYVCGTPAQTLPYTTELLEQVFENQSPKIVVLETNAIFRKSTKENKIFNQIEQIFPLFRYHDRWKSLSIKDWKLEYDYSYTNQQKGYVKKKGVEPAETDQYMTYSSEKKKIPTNNTEFVDKMQKICEKNGATLILVSTPSTINWNYPKHNTIEEYANKSGLTFIDMNLMQKEIPIDWNKDTSDAGDHLNGSGAKKATEFIGKYLEETHLFEDKRNVPEYSEWNNTKKQLKK